MLPILFLSNGISIVLLKMFLVEIKLYVLRMYNLVFQF